MLVVVEKAELQAIVSEVQRNGERVGLVPTMGALHEGHSSLIRQCREICDLTIVSVFVNKTQFGPDEDYDSYPRDMETDSRLCRDCGVDVLFCPTTSDVYCADDSTIVEERELSLGMCGSLRPGHFRGVATVVAKLFNIVQPDVAVFGQKDAQQVRVIQRMMRDLCFPVEIVVAPTVREADGLAMSSRNAYLTAEERVRATSLRRALCRAEEMYADGVVDTERVREEMRRLIEDGIPAEVAVRIEYLVTVDSDSLKPVDTIDRPVLVAIAARIGNASLIDNTVVGVKR